MRRRAVELERALAHVGFDAVERLEEIGLPGGAAVFAVGDRLQAGGFLLLDQRLDLAVLDRLELLAAVISPFSRLARASLSACERSRLPT